MAWTFYQSVIAVVMVVTGSINTISTKWADKIISKNSAGEMKPFDHPFLQACSMFLGEMSCIFAFYIIKYYKKYKQDSNYIPDETPKFNPFIFLPPALCDMTATSMMYIGLNLTYASSFQMLRGAIIIFTGLLSTAFLGRLLNWREWIGIWIVLAGLVIVGLSDLLFGSTQAAHSTNDIITGDLIIIIAQIIGACQVVWEEKYVNKYNVPALQAVGWEGIFGFTTLSVLLIPMYYIPVGEVFSSNPRHVLEDASDAFVQLHNSHLLQLAFIGTLVSIAFFNFAGISVTKEISATTRMVLDSVRTLVIWLFGLAVKWQKFQYLQIIGFLVLLVGMSIYNNVIIIPLLQRYGLLRRREDDEERLTDNREINNDDPNA